MSDEEVEAPAGRPYEELRAELDGGERRVLGVLVEKHLTTPDYYPMTQKALVAGCNQKNNRDPVTSMTEDDVREVLASLQSKRLVMAVRPDGGHATRWRHELDRRFGIQNRELAVMGELFLRGPQTEGELRARASRMREIADVDTLHETLARLRGWTPPLVVRLSPEGAIRGVRWTHALYPTPDMQAILAGELTESAAHEVLAQLPPSGTTQLQDRLAQAEARLSRIEAFLQRELGATFDASAPPGGAA